MSDSPMKFMVMEMILLTILLCNACSSMGAGFYNVFIDHTSGEIILNNQPNVKILLENIIDSDEKYSIRAFMRTALRFQHKRTKLLAHSFYLLVGNSGEYHTLSYYGTKFAPYSEGAWVVDADADMESYKMYQDGNNEWDVIEIFSEKTIDTRKTLENIIDRMSNGITYYYMDHIRDKANVDNCNTALYETVTFTEL
jgi:hypothetical protein